MPPTEGMRPTSENPTKLASRLAGRAAALIGLLAVAIPARAQDYQAVTLSLFYPVSTNRSTDVYTNFRLSLIHGSVGTLHGVDINGLVGLTGEAQSGVLLTGAFSRVGREFGGVAVTGGVGILNGDARGLQVSGLVNYNGGSFRGVQYSTFFNYGADELRGAQLSTLVNMVDGEARYLQLAGFANMVGGGFRGLQFGSIVNFVNRDMRGAQLAIGNVSSDTRGVQLGAVNIGGTVRGFQGGLLNHAREHRGVPFGVLNFADNGSVDWVSFVSSFAAFNTGIRTEVNNFYSMLTLGWNDLKAGRDDTIFATWNYGYAYPVSNRFSIGGDLGFVHIAPQDSDDPNLNNEDRPGFQARALVEARFSPKFAIFGGGGSSTEWSAYSSSAQSETDLLGFLGVAIF